MVLIKLVLLFQMVPINEMSAVLKVVKHLPHLKEKDWVRLRRSKYKDDLAQVDWIDLAQNMVHLKLIPRVDYTRMRGALRTSQDSQALKKKKRPPQKLFDADQIRAIGGEVGKDGDFFIFEGDRFDQHRGFLYKSFPLSYVIADGVKPTLAELERFQVDASEDISQERK